MKKGKLFGLSLSAVLLLAGCSCNKNEVDNSVKANINNGEQTFVSGLKDGVVSVNLQTLYDDLKSVKGNTQAANKLLEIIFEEIKNDPVWKARYEAKIKAELDKLVEKYTVDGKFDEESLAKSLRVDGYTITCENNTYGPRYNQDETVDYRLCDYSDYENKALKLNALKELINEKYIYEKVLKDNENLFKSKKVRLVEYIEIDSSHEDADKFIKDEIDALIAGTTTLEEIKEKWISKMLDEVDEKFEKIGTKDDVKGSILKEFTGGYIYDKKIGLEKKKEEVSKQKVYDKLIITSDSNSILNASLVGKLLSDNVLSETAGKTYEVHEGEYYLVSPLAGTNIDATDIKITDVTAKKYYIVKVDVVTSDIPENDENQVKANLVYDAIKLLVSDAALVKDSVNYYLEQNKDKISVHDDEVYAYLKTQYPTIFVD